MDSQQNKYTPSIRFIFIPSQSVDMANSTLHVSPRGGHHPIQIHPIQQTCGEMLRIGRQWRREGADL
ncbi:hypothetical protein VFPPC_17755 [Pochonia chlamydosporia 170]|uniref:Uncharacterized protein n=1 Tax=Pochonia chlamydosporia 170 TaxID=1380566 RepID=A0A219AR37_METCM|nr:hypothetical protein VFPPC_17755 [Pochonia chlamydosporia 170]OWT43069.1 hypothetical protein VFPPC_17755 [Pochonia chlamydosporia 170]